MTTRYSRAEFGCNVIADNARSYAYHLAACENDQYPEECVPTMWDCSCPLDDPLVAYQSVALDPAPWYDATEPASEEFLGAMILTVAGATDSTAQREVSDAFGDGSILRRLRLQGRSMVMEMLVLATSCRGQDYGIEWLRRALEQETCGCAPDPCDSCAGKRFGLRVECNDGVPCDTGFRSWENTGIVDGITLVQDDALAECNCVAQKVTVTLHSESPYSFSCEENPCSLTVDPNDLTLCIDWARHCRECCDDDGCDRCAFDPLCSCFTGIDPVPTVLQTEDDCYCEPLERIIQSCCLTDVGIAYDQTFKLELYSGFDNTGSVDGLAFTDLGLRNTRISLFQNPNALPCITDQASYDAFCLEQIRPDFELQIPFVPADSTLIIDGRSDRILLECDGRCTPYPYKVQNTVGPLFPLVTGCAPAMLVIEWDKINSQQLTGVDLAASTLNVTTFRRRLS